RRRVRGRRPSAVLPPPSAGGLFSAGPRGRHDTTCPGVSARIALSRTLGRAVRIRLASRLARGGVRAWLDRDRVSPDLESDRAPRRRDGRATAVSTVGGPRA